MSPEPSTVLEFTVEPFVEHEPGPHVVAAIGAAEEFDAASVDIGPFGTTVEGDRNTVLAAAQAVLAQAFANGATRVVLQVTEHVSNDVTAG